MTVVASGRVAAQARMRDTLAFGAVERGPQNADGEEGDVFVAAFTAPGKVSGRGRGDLTVRTVTVGGVERPVIDGGVHMPAERTEAVPFGTVVRVQELGPESPAHLLGRLYRVVGESVKSDQTARRFDVVEV